MSILMLYIKCIVREFLAIIEYNFLFEGIFKQFFWKFDQFNIDKFIYIYSIICFYAI